MIKGNPKSAFEAANIMAKLIRTAIISQLQTPSVLIKNVASFEKAGYVRGVRKIFDPNLTKSLQDADLIGEKHVALMSGDFKRELNKAESLAFGIIIYNKYKEDSTKNPFLPTNYTSQYFRLERGSNNKIEYANGHFWNTFDNNVIFEENPKIRNIDIDILREGYISTKTIPALFYNPKKQKIGMRNFMDGNDYLMESLGRNLPYYLFEFHGINYNFDFPSDIIFGKKMRQSKKTHPLINICGKPIWNNLKRDQTYKLKRQPKNTEYGVKDGFLLCYPPLNSEIIL